MAGGGRRGVFSRARAAIRMGILGKSDPDYVRHLTGDDRYWDEAIAAQLGWPGHRATPGAVGR